ncbi:hypothetical protein LLB_2900 [Legionella longbeachae D-4968]|nr:hypothetical protein LLB_2900 [Legionella longbeachae D-4968]
MKNLLVCFYLVFKVMYQISVIDSNHLIAFGIFDTILK